MHKVQHRSWLETVGGHWPNMQLEVGGATVSSPPGRLQYTLTTIIRVSFNIRVTNTQRFLYNEPTILMKNMKSYTHKI